MTSGAAGRSGVAGTLGRMAKRALHLEERQTRECLYAIRQSLIGMDSEAIIEQLVIRNPARLLARSS